MARALDRPSLYDTDYAAWLEEQVAHLRAGRLAALEETRSIAARTLAVVRQNLWWASIYNLVAIPAAAIGLLNPWMAGVGMSLSSAVVVANALRLRRGA